MTEKKIAVLCDYRLLPERVGGMDYFFWKFDAKCREHNIVVDWFFPNIASHGCYAEMTIIPQTEASIEKTFQKYFKVEKPNYTHVVTHFLELCTPFFKKIKELSGAKIIAVDHNPRPLEGYPLKKRFKKRLKGHLYSNYIDVFVGVSNYTVRELIKDFGKQIQPKTITVYNGVQIQEIKIRKVRAEKHLKFLVASHLRQSKGIQDLIEAVAMLPSNLKNDLKIDVYGDGPYKGNLADAVAKHQLHDMFKFHGSTDSLKDVFCNYDYLLHPTHMECFSLTLLESLAANVPVVTTPVGGNPEVVRDGENGFLYEARNVRQLALLLEQLITGEKKITRNTRTEIAERFTIEKMVEKHFKLL